eukprot:9922954-Lingulodinium_polyedra.AAC.1
MRAGFCGASLSCSSSQPSKGPSPEQGARALLRGLPGSPSGHAEPVLGPCYGGRRCEGPGEPRRRGEVRHRV